MITHNNNYYYTNEEVRMLKQKFNKKISEINLALKVHQSLLSVSFSCTKNVYAKMLKMDVVNPLGVVTIPNYLKKCILNYEKLGFISIYKYTERYEGFTSLAFELSKL